MRPKPKSSSTFWFLTCSGIKTLLSAPFCEAGEAHLANSGVTTQSRARRGRQLVAPRRFAACTIRS
jgi:hypothetical protein